MKMHKAILPCTMAILMVSAGGALAQSGSSATASNSSVGSGAAGELTCAQLGEMDAAALPGAANGSNGGAADDANVASTAPNPSVKDNPAQVAPDKGDGSAMASNNGALSGSSMADARETSANTASSATDGSGLDIPVGHPRGEGQLAVIAGFYDMPAEDLASACLKSPDAKIADIVADSGNMKAGMNAEGAGAQSTND
jgi:hypothetical protein